MRTSFAVCAIAFVQTLHGGLALATPQAETITEPQVRAHLDFLASDLLEGRDSGYRGGELAAAYLESQLTALGFKPLFDKFQMPFDIQNAAGRPKVRLKNGANEHSDPTLVDALAQTATGNFHGKLVTMNGDPKDKLVVATGGDDVAKANEIAAELFAKGAKGVVFVTTQEKFESRARRDGRRRATPKPTAPPTPPKDAPAKPAGGYLEPAPSAEEAFFASHTVAPAEATLSGPVIRVSRDLGDEIMSALDHDTEVDLSITRDGVDRTANVIGWIEGSDPKLREEYAVIGGHYDHVGYDDQGNIWNGTDDNGSGTVSVLEVAQALAHMTEKPKRSVVVCFWGAEERGLLGSIAFMATKRLDPEKIAAYINLDMVSRNDPNSIFGLNVSQDLFDLAIRMGKPHGMEVAKGAEMFLTASDSGPFIQAEVPTLFFFCGLHDQYHTPADDPGTVDYGKIARVAQTAFDVLVSVANDSKRPTMTKPQAESRRRLGIYPDDTAKGEGVTISSVFAKSVASNAGMQKGDRIVKIGDKPVKDMESLRTAIAAPADGAKFSIEVVRGSEKVMLTAIFEAEAKRN